MAQTYKQNKTFNPDPVISGLKSLGATMPPRRRRSKQVSPNRYSGLARNVNQSAPNRPAPRGPLPTGLQGLGTVTTPYGGSTRYEGMHPGVDIANKIGTNIPTQTAGRVIDVVRGTRQGSKGFGNYVIVEDESGYQHRYSHLHQAYVQKGQLVPKGQAIGSMGNTGQTYSLHGGDGSHLDYRIKDAYGKYVNPYTYNLNI